MKLNIDGRELVAKNMDTARTRDVIELQRSSGMKLSEIVEQVQNGGEALAMAVLGYLTLHNAGFTPSWDEVLDRPLGDFEVIEDAAEQRQREEAEAQEAQAAADPQPARTDSRPGDSAPEPLAPEPSATPTSPPSSETSLGSSSSS